MEKTSVTDTLGLLEEIVLLAVKHSKPDEAYGVKICEQLENAGYPHFTYGAIATVLQRLAKKNVLLILYPNLRGVVGDAPK